MRPTKIFRLSCARTDFRLMKTLFIALCSIGLFLASALGDDGPNLLQNGDLVQGDEGSPPPGWTFSKWNLPSDGAESTKVEFGLFTDPDGSRCLRITTSRSSQTFVWWQQEVPAQGGASYKLRVRAKGTKIEGEKGYAGIAAGVYFFDAQGKWLGYEKISPIEFSDQWQSYEGAISIPDDATKIGVRLSLQGDMPCSACFDRISLTAN